MSFSDSAKVARTTSRNRFLRRARAALICGGVAMALLQLGLCLALERWPQVRYPEYGFKLARLRERMMESPARPLVVLMGSSRTEVGLRAEKFDLTSEQPLVFNFALAGAGPIQHLMLLEDLLAEGIHPDRLAMEVHPLFLNQICGALREEARIDIHRLGPADLAVLAQYSEAPNQMRQKWWKWRLLPSHAFRHQLLDCCWSDWCAGIKQYGGFSHLGPLGWLPFPARPANEAEHKKMLDHARWEYKDFKGFEFEVTEEPDRAMRTLLWLCRQHQICMTMYIMPEGSQFQEVYPPDARARVDEYLAKLRREYDFDLYDATGWMRDDAFADSHHLLPEAADEFSRRFAREILRPALGLDDGSHMAEGVTQVERR
ncbi:MAG TPA: DUF1574 family protein [Pirellulales bacterium]|nr:DUF1574 family protein [Pirellulales bacterium]